MRIIWIAALLLMLASCGLSALEHDPNTVFDDPDAYTFTDTVVEAIKNEDGEALTALSDPEFLQIENYEDELAKLFDLLPGDTSREIVLYYSELRTGTRDGVSVPVYYTVHDIIAGDTFGVLEIAVAPLDGQCCVATFGKVSPSESQVSTYYDFTFEGKGLKHYLVFAVFLVVPVFMVGTAIACGLNPLVPRKILWIPFILVGLWGVDFNWATGKLQNELLYMSNGDLQFSLIQIHLLGASFLKFGAFQPWIFTIGSPIGALAYWFEYLGRKPEDGAPEDLDQADQSDAPQP